MPIVTCECSGRARMEALVSEGQQFGSLKEMFVYIILKSKASSSYLYYRAILLARILLI